MPQLMWVTIPDEAHSRMSSCRDGAATDLQSAVFGSIRGYTKFLLPTLVDHGVPTDKCRALLAVPERETTTIQWSIRLVKREYGLEIDPELMRRILTVSQSMFPGSTFGWTPEERVIPTNPVYDSGGYERTGMGRLMTYGALTGVGTVDTLVPGFYWAILVYRALANSTDMREVCAGADLTLQHIVNGLALTPDDNYYIWDLHNGVANLDYYRGVLNRRWYYNGILNVLTGRGPQSVEAGLKFVQEPDESLIIRF